MNVLSAIAAGLLEVRSLMRHGARQLLRHWRDGQVEAPRPVGTLPR